MFSKKVMKDSLGVIGAMNLHSRFDPFILREDFTVEKFSIMLINTISRWTKQVSDVTWFSWRTRWSWTRRGPTRTCPARGLSPGPRWVWWNQRFRGFPPDPGPARACRTERRPEHHAVGAGRTGQNLQLSLLIDDKIVSFDNVVGVKLLVGELHLFGSSNLCHLLVVIPQSHISWGQAEVTVKSLLELFDRLTYRDLFFPALIFEIEANLKKIYIGILAFCDWLWLADLNTHIRTEVDVDERIQNTVDLHKLLPSLGSRRLRSFEEISDESSLGVFPFCLGNHIASIENLHIR